MKITKGREPTDQVSMALPPKFLAACRLVFGDDKTGARAQKRLQSSR